jgi:hypothetical protein
MLAVFVGTLFLTTLPSAVTGQILFSDDFDTDHTANWTVNKSTGANANDAGSFANFFFDYSTIGIPSAPNAGGTTVGLKLEANFDGDVFSGLSVSPTGQSFSGDYRLTFNIWWNFVGPAPDGGNGSTQVTGAGIGTAGTTAQWAGSLPQESIFFGATGDGGSASDFRAYSSAAPSSYAAGNAVYAAPSGAINNTAAYYAALGGNTPPAAQAALFPQQTNTTAAGAPAFAWHDGLIEKSGNSVAFTIDGLLIATVDASTATLGGGNILFTQFDVNSASSTDPNVRSLEFGLIDNVVVTQVPEPTTCSLVILGIAAVCLARKHR